MKIPLTEKVKGSNIFNYLLSENAPIIYTLFVAGEKIQVTLGLKF